MDAKRLRLAARLLDIAAGKFSSFGCNDFELPKEWSDDECRRLDLAICEANGDPSDHYPNDDHRTQMDWILMGYLADLLRAEAKEREQG